MSLLYSTSGTNLFDTPMEFFEKVDFEKKNRQTTRKHETIPREGGGGGGAKREGISDSNTSKRPTCVVMYICQPLDDQIVPRAVRASPASLRCVFAQDTLILALYWFNRGRLVPT